ncbi:MAG: sensor histidine kinase, partial [Microbacterium sp.]
GQLGMRERALASGGTIDLLPRPQGGFRVRARIPLISSQFESRKVRHPNPIRRHSSDSKQEGAAAR